VSDWKKGEEIMEKGQSRRRLSQEEKAKKESGVAGRYIRAGGWRSCMEGERALFSHPAIARRGWEESIGGTKESWEGGWVFFLREPNNHATTRRMSIQYASETRGVV